jgi:hypothetical protein
VRNVRDGGRHSHADAAFATPAKTGLAYDFDPRTLAKNSGITAANEKERLLT